MQKVPLANANSQAKPRTFITQKTCLTGFFFSCTGQRWSGEVNGGTYDFGDTQWLEKKRAANGSSEW